MDANRPGLLWMEGNSLLLLPMSKVPEKVEET